MKAKGNSTRGNPKNPYKQGKRPKETKPGIKNWSTQNQTGEEKRQANKLEQNENS